MWAQVAIAYVIDLVVGDPKAIPHPVVLIGRLIAYLERVLLPRISGRKIKRLLGAIVVIFIVCMSTVATWGIVMLSAMADKRLGFIVSIWLISTTIATKGLMDSARDVVIALKTGGLREAKKKVSNIVGRDTDKMGRKDVIRATIESLAENAVDGVIAPIMYALIGGAPLAMAYKAVNTLDSMIGYRNERYEDFGWAAARLDDALNYIPARISVVIFALSAYAYRRSYKNVIKIAIRDARNHASPNSGFPEAAVAGAFGLKLGGINYYGGVPRKSGYIGDGKEDFKEKDINEVVGFVFIASAMTILLARAVIFAVDYLMN